MTFIDQDEDGVESYDWVVEEAAAGERIDKFIAERMAEGVSRTQVQGWLKDGHVTVGGREVKANYKLQPGDEVGGRRAEASDVALVPEPIRLTLCLKIKM